jgi:hypothetical protein
VNTPLVDHSSKKKQHFRIRSLLWSWSNLFPSGGVVVGVIFEGVGDQGGDVGIDFFLLRGD